MLGVKVLGLSCYLNSYYRLIFYLISYLCIRLVVYLCARIVAYLNSKT